MSYSDNETVVEPRVQTTVELLKDRPEADRDKYMDALGLTPAEKEKVRKLLWAPPPRPKFEPKALRKQETFQRLVQDVRRGKAILFLGAGVSQDVGMPSSDTLADALKSLAQNYRVPIEQREYTLPEIAGLLERSDLRREVIETLKQRFDAARSQDIPPYRKGFFRLLPYLGELNKLILTTNWDDLLELAFLGSEPVMTIRRDRELPLVPAAPHAVIKLHGDFTEPDSLIISDTDYAQARSSISRPGGLAGSLWGVVSTLLAQHSWIFAGYRLGDEDMKLLRSLVAARQVGTETRNYVVGPFDSKERQSIEDWSGLEVIPATASEFFVALAQELAEFANRRDDLDRIFRLEASLFIEFYAPFNAGKHALLDAIERRAQGEGWQDDQVVRVDLRREPRPLTIARLTDRMAEAIGQTWIKRGERLAQVLKDKRRLLLLFEHTEAVEEHWEDFITFVTEVVAPVVKELNTSGQRSRLILSGRYPVEGWSFSFKRDAEVFPLSPFTLSAVREMVGKYTLFQDPMAAIAPPSPGLVKQIYDLTGRSHPGFIKEILDDLMKKLKKPDGKFELPPGLTEQETDGYLASFLEAIHKEVWSTASREIEDLFTQGLCVLRRLNAGLLARLAQEDVFRDIFSSIGKPEGVINALRKCHLLTYEFPLEVVDPIIRQIHSNALRRDKGKPERLVQANYAAASAWKGLLPSVEDSTQLNYYREWLYHLANYLKLDGKTEESRWEALQEELKTIFFRTSQPYPIGMGKALLDDIEEKRERDRERDGELYDALLDCLGEVYYEKFHQLVIAKQEVTR